MLKITMRRPGRHQMTRDLLILDLELILNLCHTRDSPGCNSGVIFLSPGQKFHPSDDMWSAFT